MCRTRKSGTGDLHRQKERTDRENKKKKKDELGNSRYYNYYPGIILQRTRAAKTDVSTVLFVGNLQGQQAIGSEIQTAHRAQSGQGLG